MARQGTRTPHPDVIGIKELKDQASAIVEKVRRTRRPVVVTRNNREVARIVPMAAAESGRGFQERLADLGLLSVAARAPWKELTLVKLGLDASVAVSIIREDRDDG